MGPPKDVIEFHSRIDALSPDEKGVPCVLHSGHFF